MGAPIDIDKAPAQEAQRRLKDVVRSRLARIPAEIHTRITFVSEVPKTILASARDLAADLIVMATHGGGAIHHLFFGSVTEAVVRNAVCPVLTLRPAAEPEPNPKAAKPAKVAKPAASAKKKSGALR